MSLAQFRATGLYASGGETKLATRSARAVEYDLFARATAQLRAAAKTRCSDFATLARALHENRRLWTTIAADLMSDDNAFPDTLRAQLLSLNAFVQSYSGKALREAISVRPLVEINMCILRGLGRSGDS